MSKRVRRTGTGRLKREMTGLRHLLEGKSSKYTRRHQGTADIAAKGDVRRVKRLLAS